MLTIAVIKKNQCVFDKIENVAAELLYRNHDKVERTRIKKNINDYIWSVIEPYIEFCEIEPEYFAEELVKNITKCFPDKQIDGNFYFHSENSYSFPKTYMEIVHCQPLWHGYVDAEVSNMNNIACLASLKHTVIENNCVMLAYEYDLHAPKFTRLTNITRDHILRIIRRRFYFSAVLIKENQLVKYYYQQPKYLLQSIYGLYDDSTIETMTNSLLGYNLIYYFQHDKTKYVNEIATRINGMYQLHGDVLIIHELDNNNDNSDMKSKLSIQDKPMSIYGNLSNHEVKRLDVLSYGRLYDRQLKPGEIHTVKQFEVNENGKEIENNITPMWSRYIIVKHRMEKLHNDGFKCLNCDKIISKKITNIVKNSITCDKCYRARYCSNFCQQEFLSKYHQDECINPKSYL